ncbi:MAG: ABC transporter permease [Bacteroidota bacterium]
MKSRILAVASFEFLQKIKTRSFLIYMFIFPVIVMASAVIPAILSQPSGSSPSVIAIIDKTGTFVQPLSKELNNFRLPDGQPRYIPVNLPIDENPSQTWTNAVKDLKKGNFAGILLLDNSSFVYKGRTTALKEDIRNFETSVNRVITVRRLERLGLPGSTVSSIRISELPSELDDDKTIMQLMAALFFVILLFMTIMFSGGLLVRSMIEEKSNRILEILLSSCSPGEILTGKIAGLAALGLFQLSVWIMIAWVLSGQGILPVGIFANAGLSIVYFLLGYLLFTSLFVGVGSIVTTEQQAQHITAYLSILLVVPMVLSLKVAETPDAFWVKILSFFPLTSPSVMFIRMASSQTSAWENTAIILIMVFSVIVVIWFSSVAFSSAVLDQGGRNIFRRRGNPANKDGTGTSRPR